MLPNPYDMPAGPREQPILYPIPLDVGIEFVGPELGIRGRDLAMDRAVVPVAAIDKNSHTAPGERDIRSHEPAIDPHRVVLAEPIAGRVQRFPEDNFRLCVGPFDRGHVQRTPCWRWQVAAALSIGELALRAVAVHDLVPGVFSGIYL